MSSLAKRVVTPSGTTLHIDGPELDKLHAHAREGFPYEVVGILAGSRDGLRVTRVRPLVNERADSAASRYRVNGLVLMRAEDALAAEGLEVVGYYHSHPDHPAMYSDTDRDLAMPNMSYVITAVHGNDSGGSDVVDTRAWRLRQDRSAMDAEELRVLR